MRSKSDIEKLFMDAYEADDGHFYDADECWYCGYQAGMKSALLYVLRYFDEFEQNKVEPGERPKLGYCPLNIEEQRKIYFDLKDKEIH